MNSSHRLVVLLTLLLGLGVGARAASAQPAPQGLERIRHIIVIYLENHSFDNLYGTFPGANGLGNASAVSATQTDAQGNVYATLPPVMNTMVKPAVPDERFPKNLPNQPFLIDTYVSPDQKVPDLVHRFYQHQEQVHGGKLDRFAAVSDAAGLAMGYHDLSRTALWGYAQRFTLADNFLQAAWGGSFLNHFWLVCACTPRYEGAPDAVKAVLGADGRMVKDGAVTPDGFAVNTIQPVYAPHVASITDKARLLPPVRGVTIGDRLTAQGVGWAWYSGGWNDALAGKPPKLFQYHHQPFAYFEQFGDGTPAKAQHLKDEADLLAGIAAGSLPPVVFYKPVGDENQHPGYANLAAGDRKIGDVLARLERSPLWEGAVIVITYDEFGGYWDHVPPPVFDRWGPGSRVPTLIISPFAKRGFVDHTLYDTTSILKLIEERFGLAPLSDREAKVGDLTGALELR